MISEVKEIDIKKIKKETKYKFPINIRLDNIAKITGKLYSINGNANSAEIAENSKVDFIALFRMIYNDVINTFDNDLRKKIKNSGINIHKEENEKIQEVLDVEAIFYENNRSEIQAQLVTETNKNEIDKSIASSIAIVSKRLLDDKKNRNKLENDLQEIERNIEFGIGNDKSLKEKRKDTIKELSKVNDEINEINNNKNKVVAKEIITKMKKDNIARSELIAEQEVGNTESFIRQKEAEEVSKSNILVKDVFIGSKLKKKWDATLDNRTRESHARADGQIVKINEKFYVGGEYLISPRDINGSYENIARCRCESIIIGY